MNKNIQAIRGMPDLLPDNIESMQRVENALRELSFLYGYRELRTPILEQTHLFKRTIGEATDIVEKEMYTFSDRNGDSLSMRPEGTASCVRAGIQHGLLYNQTQRLWYMGPMFRHERPQKGRYRQFYQYGLEAFGFEGPDIDAEIILFCQNLWQQLGLSDKLTLQLNTLGELPARERYKADLVDYLRMRFSELDADSQRRLDTNPLRILDSKNQQTQALLKEAPVLWDYLDEKDKVHFETLQSYLQGNGIKFQVNPRLVRGLDYYNRTVFEWVTTELGTQGTVCAGGHYDGLVEQLGGKATPAIGFALGLERVAELLQQQEAKKPLAYIIVFEAHLAKAFQLREQLLTEHPVLVNCGGGDFKKQLKKADKSGAEYAVIIEDAERVSIKHLRDGSQQSCTFAEVVEFFKTHVS